MHTHRRMNIHWNESFFGEIGTWKLVLFLCENLHLWQWPMIAHDRYNSHNCIRLIALYNLFACNKMYYIVINNKPLQWTLLENINQVCLLHDCSWHVNTLGLGKNGPYISVDICKHILNENGYIGRNKSLKGFSEPSKPWFRFWVLTIR